jgi:hypothetical protein
MTTTSLSAPVIVRKNQFKSTYTGPVPADFPMLAANVPEGPGVDCPPPASAFVLESLPHWAYSPLSILEDDKQSTRPWDMCQVCHDVDDTAKLTRNPKKDRSACGCGPETNTSMKENTSTTQPETKLIMMTQLPCGHVYHTGCISQWLACHCTCPLCRYELPTDDMLFERDREERMAARKAVSIPPSPTTGDSSIWFPQPGRKHTILRQLDLTTSTTQAVYWRRPADDVAQDKPAVTATDTAATKAALKDLDARIPNTCVASANTIIASSA